MWLGEKFSWAERQAATTEQLVGELETGLRGGLQMLVNINANMKEAWKYVGSDGYIIWNWQIYFQT